MEINKEQGIVAGAVGIAIMTIVGLMIFGSLAGVDVSKEDVESFTVTDTSTDKTCHLSYRPIDTDDLQVRYYNGVTWTVLTETTHYTVAGTVVTVKASAMD